MLGSCHAIYGTVREVRFVDSKPNFLGTPNNM